MNLAALLVQAARARMAQEPDKLGVRASPITLERTDVEVLAREVDRAFGGKAFLAVSVPGAKVTDKPRTYIGPDEVAAQRATNWRNLVDVAAGERLLYVSVDDHGRAGGLADCLLAIDEAALRQAFLEEVAADRSLPRHLDVALEGAGIVDGVTARDLCAFHEAVRSSRREPWEAVGHALPLLGLARDTGIAAKSAQERLERNRELVRKVGADEVAGGAEGALLALRTALHADVEELGQALSRVDLAKYLSSPAAKRPPPRAVSRTAGRDRKPPKPTKKAGKAGPVDVKQQLVQAGTKAKGPEAGAAVTRRAGKLREAALKPVTQTEPPPLVIAVPPDYTPGLAKMLLRLLAGDGRGQRWRAKDSVQGLLKNLPDDLQAQPVELASAAEAPAVQAYLAARSALSGLLIGQEEARARRLEVLVSEPLIMLADEEVLAAAQRLLAAAAAAYGWAATEASAEDREALLRVDTLSLGVGEQGPSILVAGPLHPLWLSQGVGRLHALTQGATDGASSLSEALMRRLLAQAPACPDEWPVDGARLRASRPLAGLVTYQRTPEGLTPKELAAAARDVVALFARLLPHATPGLRVAALGQQASSVVDGVAEAIREGAVERAIVYSKEIPSLGAEAEVHLARGELQLGALPEHGWEREVRPHLVFRVMPAAPPPELAEPAVPYTAPLAVTPGLLPSVFEVIGNGVRVRTPLDKAAQPALAQMEELHAYSLGLQPRRAFLRQEFAVSLAALLGDAARCDGAWEVVLAPRVGRAPPADMFLLAHEAYSERLELAILAVDVGPASRALRGVTQQLGVQDDRPSTLRRLAEAIAVATSGGVISPARATEEVLAGSILGVALKDELAPLDGLVAQVAGPAGGVLLGEPARGGALAIGFAAGDGALQVILGFAALGRAPELYVEQGRLKGQGAALMEKLGATIDLANTAGGASAEAAREALRWLLWPVMASTERDTSAAQRALGRLGRDLKINVRAICYLPPGTAALASRAGKLKVGGVPVRLQELTSEMLDRLTIPAGGA